MGKYLLNKETQKIELHFDKQEYLLLPEEQKKEIKSNFLWSRNAGAWVSRSKNNHYWALQVAKKLNLEDAGVVGERLSYEEELNRKAERAEARSERFEEYADNAQKRAENMQAGFNEYRKDWSWLTQPNINSSRGRAFTRSREKIINRYRQGFEEYKKSDYFKERAETARQTADKKQLENPIYLHNRIKECKRNITKLEKNIIYYEEQLHKIENGEVIKNYQGEEITAEQYQNWINDTLEKLEYEIDKQAFMENCLDEIGGNRFNKDNIKVGYLVKVKRWGIVEVTGTGTVNFTYKMINETGNLKDWISKDPYEAIIEIVEAKESKDDIVNPYVKGDILHSTRPGDNSVFRAYQVIKVTKKGVKIQQIAVENGKPIKDKFISEKQNQRKITKSKWSDFVGVYEGNWQLYKYTGTE